MADHAYPDALPAQYRLHWYVLERVLGQGGFGITYLARDTNLDQAVAIKEYLPIDVATRKPDSTVRPRADDQSDRYLIAIFEILNNFFRIGARARCKYSNLLHAFYF